MIQGPSLRAISRLNLVTRRFASIVCVALVSACANGALAPASGFLSSYARMQPALDGGLVTRPISALDPSRMKFGVIEWRASSTVAVSSQEKAQLLDELRDAMLRKMQALPSAPDGEPFVLRAAITRVEPVRPSLNVVSAALLLVPLDRGGASVEVEAVAADTGEQLAALTVDYRAPLSELTAHFQKLAPVRLALRKAAHDFGLLLQAMPPSIDTRAGPTDFSIP